MHPGMQFMHVAIARVCRIVHVRVVRGPDASVRGESGVFRAVDEVEKHAYVQFICCTS